MREMNHSWRVLAKNFLDDQLLPDISSSSEFSAELAEFIEDEEILEEASFSAEALARYWEVSPHGVNLFTIVNENFIKKYDLEPFGK